MKLYLALIGCHASTPIIMNVDGTELEFLNSLRDKFKEASRYNCMPTLSLMTVRPANYETDEEWLAYGS